MRNTENYIPLDKCQKGHIYRINSRNLGIGVFDGKGGFIGIRQKFSDRYLFTEMHWDTSADYGTVKPLEEIGILPDSIPVTETHIEENTALFKLLDGFKKG